MGKTKIKLIDASQPEEETKPKKKLGRKDELVEKLKAELGAEEAPSTVIATPSETTPEAGETRGKQSPKQEIARLAESAKRATSPAPETVRDPRDDENIKSKKPQAPGKSKPRSKKYQAVSKDLDRSKSYPLPEALDMIKKLSYAKFNATIEAHINTAQTGIRGLVSLPYAAGKKLRILVFPSSPQQIEGVVFGDETSIEEINKGKVDFDLVITTAEWMPKLAKVARILGPKGLMPNPKNGTITNDLKKAVDSFQAGKTEYKTEAKAPVIHLGLGKVNQPTEQLSANIKTLLQTLGKTRVKKVSLSPTMGPSVKVALSSI